MAAGGRRRRRPLFFFAGDGGDRPVAFATTRRQVRMDAPLMRERVVGLLSPPATSIRTWSEGWWRDQRVPFRGLAAEGSVFLAHISAASRRCESSAVDRDLSQLLPLSFHNLKHACIAARY